MEELEAEAEQELQVARRHELAAEAARTAAVVWDEPLKVEPPLAPKATVRVKGGTIYLRQIHIYRDHHRVCKQS